MKQSGYFITGTDTGVGKTVVSTVITLGLKAIYWKPIQTGAIDETDRSFAEHWVGNRTWPEVYTFAEPVSPHIAAAHVGERIDEKRIEREFQLLSGNIVVEGAGGALVPINEDAQIVDVISLLKLPCIVVASTRLGTINHSLLTFESIRSRKIVVSGFITVGDDSSEISKSIEHFSGSRSLGHVPFCKTFSKEWFESAFHGLDIPQIQKEKQYAAQP